MENDHRLRTAYSLWGGGGHRVSFGVVLVAAYNRNYFSPSLINSYHRGI